MIRKTGVFYCCWSIIPSFAEGRSSLMIGQVCSTETVEGIIRSSLVWKCIAQGTRIVVNIRDYEMDAKTCNT